MKVKKKNLTRLASLSALGAGALTVGAKHADAGIVYTVFPPPGNTVGFNLGGPFFTAYPIVPGGGLGGFSLFTRTTYTTKYGRSHATLSSFFQILLRGLSGLQFQDAPGPGFMWNATAPVWSSKVLRSKKSVFQYLFSLTTITTHTPNGNTNRNYFPTNTHTAHNYSMPIDRVGDFYLLFQFNPTGSQVDYGWLHLFGPPVTADVCGCALGPDVVAVDMAFDDSGALIAAGDTGAASTPEPATMFPTAFAALALGATGVRRWRASRKKAA